MSDRLAEIEALLDEVRAWQAETVDGDLAVAKAARGVDTRCVVALRAARYEERCGECSRCRLRAALANLEGGA